MTVRRGGVCLRRERPRMLAVFGTARARRCSVRAAARSSHLPTALTTSPRSVLRAPRARPRRPRAALLRAAPPAASRSLSDQRARPAQAASAASTALVNRAYRTLRDPVERGRYWLELHGVGAGTRQQRCRQLSPLSCSRCRSSSRSCAARSRRNAPRACKRVDGDRRADRRSSKRVRSSSCLRIWPSGRTRAMRARWPSRGSHLADIAYIRALLRDIDKVLDG